MKKRTIVMAAGFCAAAVGDWLLAVKGYSLGSVGFLGGVAAFSCAQILWMAAHWREARPNKRVFGALAIPLVLFVCVRLWPLLNGIEKGALALYALMGPINIAMAYATRRKFYFAGAFLFVASDVMIGMRWLQVPEARALVGPLYMAAELALIVSCCLKNEKRIDLSAGNSSVTGIVSVVTASLLFVLAALIFPGGGYHPCLRMLSALGRSSVRLVDFPWSHLLFMSGMLVASWGVARLSRQLKLSPCGTALNVAGLLTIALIPEDVSMIFHNAGCHMAAIGGGVMLFAWIGTTAAKREKIFWSVLLLAAIAFLVTALLLHALKVLPFVPYSPTAQKFVILSFALWLFHLATQYMRRRIYGYAFLAIPVLLVAGGLGYNQRPVHELNVAETSNRALPPRVNNPLTDDERMGFNWLDYVTGELSSDEEKKWWAIGGTQHGIFAKRYNIAFAGYAAAALGARGGDEASRARAGRILHKCIQRMLRTDVWAYSQSKSYWGRKPWAPDPCYRENVMYTGHLLQLLAYYELFTGDKRYHRAGGGWDFVWRDGRRVHYDVEKLIAVTVEQMRQGVNGGLTCEPGLMFFACNNHPHVALSVFKRLGYGDWTAEADRWEKWALKHFLFPKFRRGAINLVYHVRGNFMYPVGQNAFDAWSCLWYAAWTRNPAYAKALWDEAMHQIDEEWLGGAERVNERDKVPQMNCCNPEPVSSAVTAIFMSAASRACGADEKTIRLIDQFDHGEEVRTPSGFLYLNLNREWRIGATAMYLISLAESNGFHFRDFAVVP